MDDLDSFKLPEKINKNLTLCFACSEAAKSAFSYISAKLNKIENLNVIIKPVKSTYWGKNITVAGLITSEDLINTIKDIEADYIIVPAIMLKPFSNLFLDGKSLDFVMEKTNKNIYVCRDNYSICEVVELINGYV